VFPDADLKVYLVASIEERARRRQAQLEAQGVSQPLDRLIADIAARDAYDSGRELAPLRKAEDAVEIDTTQMSIAEVIEAVCGLAVAARSSTSNRPGILEPVRATSPNTDRPRKWTLSRMVRSPLDTLLYRFAYSFIPPLWRLLYRMEISGREHFPLSGPVVLASNHRSNLDPFFLGVSTPRQIHFMAKAELWKVGALGWFIDRLGAFPINRGEADRQAVRKALEMLAAGAVLGIFPEGRRQRHGGFGEIHPGVTLFSLREGVVTIPVVMEGTERIMQDRMVRFPKVRVAFGPPIHLPEPDATRSQRALLASNRLTEAFVGLASTAGEPK
jgi:1-acyl-sn-glycerol-3-phosphate acyltransferase